MQEFPKLFEKAMGEEGNPSHRKLLLIVDGLNKLDRRDNAMDLVWLPSSFPTSVRLLLSTTPGKIILMVSSHFCPNRFLCRYHTTQPRKEGMGYDESGTYGGTVPYMNGSHWNSDSWNLFVVQIVSEQEGERKAFLRMYLSKGSKKLSEKQELKIAEAPQAGNPRFLQVLLDDISVFGDFDKLNSRIQTNLKANVVLLRLSLSYSDGDQMFSSQTTAELYDVVLKRVEEDANDKKGIVSTLMSFIYASRNGLFQVRYSGTDHISAELISFVGV